MCEPNTLAIGTAVTSIIGQNNARQADKGYQNSLVQANKLQMAENRLIATTTYLEQASQANIELAQERESTAQANQDNATRGLQARGEVLAAGAESGAGGLALDSLLADFHRQEGLFRAHNDKNLLFKQQQGESLKKSEMLQAQGRIAQIREYHPEPIAPVDYIGPSLQAADRIYSVAANKQAAQQAAARKTS